MLNTLSPATGQRSRWKKTLTESKAAVSWRPRDRWWPDFSQKKAGEQGTPVQIRDGPAAVIRRL
jgi:hypothetical protein